MMELVTVGREFRQVEGEVKILWIKAIRRLDNGRGPMERLITERRNDK